MSHARVIHVRNMKPGDVYIGRRMPGFAASPWANPYRVKEHGARCLLLFLDHIEEHPDLLERARLELQAERLACWCAPGPCHGDILARLADGDGLDAIRRDVLELIGETREMFE